jgi:hypothetical protein
MGLLLLSSSKDAKEKYRRKTLGGENKTKK